MGEGLAFQSGEASHATPRAGGLGKGGHGAEHWDHREDEEVVSCSKIALGAKCTKRDRAPRSVGLLCFANPWGDWR